MDEPKLEDPERPDRPLKWIGLAMYGLAATGVGSALTGVEAIVSASGAGQQTGSCFQAAGVCGIAAALSFGLLLLALLKE